MTPGARWSAAEALLDAWGAGGGGAGMDRRLTAWGRRARYAGSGDRAAVADIVYAALRRWRSLAWPETEGGARARLLALAAQRGELGTWDGGRHAPSPPTEAEVARLGAGGAAPEGVRWDLPDWLVPLWRESLGEGAEAAALALAERAPLFLRVNRLKADPAAAVAALAEDGVAAVPGPLSPDCLRVTEGARALRRARAYLEGWVEVQDAASQAVAGFARARSGERVLDFCAGGGGKALALAAAMEGHGEIVAHDADPARMADLPARAARAGARVTVTTRPEGRFDLVFADAPCSGSGAWRRNPDAKWGFSPEDLAGLTALQGEVLEAAARFVRPGGRLVYATCSVLAPENDGAADGFAARTGWRRGGTLRLAPNEGGDGFFATWLHPPGD